MKIPPKIQRIANQLKPRFLPANYGLASGIKTSNITIKGNSLVMQQVPYRSDTGEAIPSFLCGSVSRLAHQQYLKQRIESSQLIMSFPHLFGELVDSLRHGICKVKEGECEYLIGLTPYFDEALGIEGVTRLTPFWEQFIVSETQDPRLLTANWMIESYSWDLFGDKESAIPLMAKRLSGNRIGLLSLHFSIAGGYFNISTSFGVNRFSRSSSAFIAQWASGLILSLPLDRLEHAVNTIKELGGRPDCPQAVLQYQHLDYAALEFPFREDKYKAHAARVRDESLPTIVEIVSKLPQEEILALVA